LPDALRELAATYGSRGRTAALAIENDPDVGPRATPSAEELRVKLVRHRGNVAAVARELDRDPKQVHRWMRRYGISPDSFRD